jgi:hypothetical protein
VISYVHMPDPEISNGVRSSSYIQFSSSWARFVFQKSAETGGRRERGAGREGMDDNMITLQLVTLQYIAWYLQLAGCPDRSNLPGAVRRDAMRCDEMRCDD